MIKLKYLLLVALLCLGYSGFAQTTTIWLVRHAEKETATDSATMMSASDPGLSAAGKARAQALAAILKDQKIDLVYTTPYKRTHQTAAPTNVQFQLISQTYETDKLSIFARQVLKFDAGKNILIIGHSNTLIPTLQAFGATKPFDSLSDDDYDLLFKIIIGPYGVTSTSVQYYGAKHHTTLIKDK